LSLSRIEPFPRTIILQPVSISSCLAVMPRGPRILPTKLNCTQHRHNAKSQAQHSQTRLTCHLKTCLEALTTMPLQDVCPSVRPSVCPSHTDILSKWLNISSNFFLHQVATTFEFLQYQKLWQYTHRDPDNGASNDGV